MLWLRWVAFTGLLRFAWVGRVLEASPSPFPIPNLPWGAFSTCAVQTQPSSRDRRLRGTVACPLLPGIAHLLPALLPARCARHRPAGPPLSAVLNHNRTALLGAVGEETAATSSHR